MLMNLQGSAITDWWGNPLLVAAPYLPSLMKIQFKNNDFLYFEI